MALTKLDFTEIRGEHHFQFIVQLDSPWLFLLSPYYGLPWSLLVTHIMASRGSQLKAEWDIAETSR